MKIHGRMRSPSEQARQIENRCATADGIEDLLAVANLVARLHNAFTLADNARAWVALNMPTLAPDYEAYLLMAHHPGLARQAFAAGARTAAKIGDSIEAHARGTP